MTSWLALGYFQRNIQQRTHSVQFCFMPSFHGTPAKIVRDYAGTARPGSAVFKSPVEFDLRQRCLPDPYFNPVLILY